MNQIYLRFDLSDDVIFSSEQALELLESSQKSIECVGVSKEKIGNVQLRHLHDLFTKDYKKGDSDI